MFLQHPVVQGQRVYAGITPQPEFTRSYDLKDWDHIELPMTASQWVYQGLAYGAGAWCVLVNNYNVGVRTSFWQ